MASLGGGGRTAPDDTLQGVTPEEKNFVGKFTKNSGETRSAGKKGVGWHPGGGDTRVKAIKSDSDSDSDEPQKGRQVLRRREKKPGNTAELATKKRSPGFSGK